MSVSSKRSKTSQSSQTTAKESKLGSVKDANLSPEWEELQGDSQAEEEEDICLCTILDQTYSRPTLDEYHQQLLKDAPLFPNILTLDKDKEDICVGLPSPDDTSILVSGFGIRNLASLQNALQCDERKRLYELYKAKKALGDQTQSILSVSSPALESKISTETETDISSAKSDTSAQKVQLQYLLGLDAEAEEECVEVKEAVEEEKEKFIFSISSTVNTAQKYLRTHRIFDFFRFIIAHLLSAVPENPITFILILLNKCLLYRSGYGVPPLLYQKKHIEQLFMLMDKMDTGYIEIAQYKTGMHTLGICEYNTNPLVTEDKMVPRETFIQEALDSETALFEDLIRRKWIGKKPPAPRAPAATTPSLISGPYFIPSDLMLRVRKTLDGAAYTEMEEGG